MTTPASAGRRTCKALPHPDYQGICYPAKCNGAPDSDPLYVSKHDGIQNFTSSWNPYDWSRQVPITELSRDLKAGDVPRFGYIVPDECHDMHGDPPYCLDSGNLGDPQQQHLDSVGDAYLGQLVSEITHAKLLGEGQQRGHHHLRQRRQQRRLLRRGTPAAARSRRWWSPATARAR